MSTTETATTTESTAAEVVKATKSVADLLKSAAAKKPPSKAPSGYLWDGQPDLPFDTLIKARANHEAKAAYETSKVALTEVVDPWYADQVRKYGYQATVRFVCGINADGSTNECRLAYQHRYSRIPLAREEKLRAIVGDKFGEFFQKMTGLKIRKEIQSDPEQLQMAVTAMMEGTVAEHFAEWFEYEEFLYPTRAWTERRYVTLTDEQIAACGIHQTVSFTDGTKEE